MDFAKNIIFTFSILSAAVLAGSAIFIQTPDNVAVVMGERVVLNCESNHILGRDAFRWQMIQKDMTTIAPASCSNTSTPLAGYAVDLPFGTQICNLIILNATTSQSGQYRCFNLADQAESAESQVIVLETVPQCTTQPASLLNVSDTALMSCSVSCYGNTDTGPMMTWYDSTGLEVSANNTGTHLSPNYVTQVTPSIPTVDSYACVTNFTAVPQSTGSNPANNIPSYTSMCTTRELTVQYAPFSENITITPDTSNYFYIGQTLLCSATAVPRVFGYQWMNESEVIISDSSVITLDHTGENLIYTCAVWNELGSNRTTIKVKVVAILEVMSTTSVDISTAVSDPYMTSASDCLLIIQSSNCLGLALGLGLGLGIPLLVAMVFNVILYNKVRVACQHKGSTQAAKPLPSQAKRAYVYNSDEAFNFDDVSGHPQIEHHYMNVSAAESGNPTHYEVLKNTRNFDASHNFDISTNQNPHESPYQQLNVMSNSDQR